MYQRIVVPLDGSSESERVLRHVEPLAEQFKATVTLVHVVPRLSSAAVAASPIWEPTYVKDRETELATLTLRSVADALQGKPFTVENLVLEGNPAEEIVRFARESGADLIAMATHGRGGIERLVVGSVADEVIRHSSCAVLLTRVNE